MAEAKPYNRNDDQLQKSVKEAAGDGLVDRIVEPIEEEKRKAKTRRERERKGATYRIGQDLIDRINDTAAKLGVEKTGFVKALLTHALDDLDAKKWELPPAQKTKIKLKI
jgi:predicted GNAT family acetyltransferase